MVPPKQILAAVDFSEPSRVALMFAARLATHCGARLHVLYAEDPMLASAARSADVDLTSETRSELDAFVRSAIPAGDLAPHCHIITGPAIDVIESAADSESADLIVVGAHGMSGVARIFFGSTTEGVLRRADRSVFVVPASWQPPRPDLRDLTAAGPVVVGIDTSPAAVAAAGAARRLATTLGTSAEAIHVVPPLPVPARWSDHAVKAQAMRIDAAKAEIGVALRDVEGGATMPLTIQSGPVPELLAGAVATTTTRHPILVLGRRPHKQRGDAPGSTALRVLALAQAPLLMYLPDR